MQPEEENTTGQPGGGADPGDLDQPEPRKKSRLKPLLWALFGLAATLAVAFAGLLLYFLGPAEVPGREQVVLIRPGMTLPAIARELEDKGVIRSAPALLLAARLNGHMGAARAGEFLLSSGWPAQEVLRVITTTSGILHKVVVREGLPWWTAAKLFEAEGLADRESFELAAKNATLLQKYSIPGDSAEGFLFPETYQLSRGQADNGTAVVEAMLKEFDRQARKLWPQGPPPAEELRRIVILASLVERETGDASERPRVAGVFLNRLKLGMRLQCDPTTIYGLGPSFDGDLKRSHLEDAGNRYNTYAHAGLPPGPICSPGLASLQAAMAPEAHGYLYFVARGDGTHEFSATLDEHNRAVNRFQRRRDPQTYQSAPQAAMPQKSAAPSKTGQAKPGQAKTDKTKPDKAKPAKSQTDKSNTGKDKAAKTPHKDAKAPHKPQAKAS